MKIVESKIPCPQENCKSSDAYHVYEDGHGFCFSCNKPTFPKNYRPENCIEELLDDRSIPPEVSEKLSFFALKDEKGRTLFHKYVYPNGAIKIRRCVDKKFWVDGTTKPPAIGGVGLYDAGGKYSKAVVVEGEVDAASAYFMLNNGMKNETPVYWLTTASIPFKGRQQIFDELNKYERVVIASENDEAGKKAKEILSSVLTNKLYTANLVVHKDANEYLVNNKVAEFKKAVTNAAKYTADFVFNGIEDFSQIILDAETESYVPTPFSQLNSVIKGLPLGHVVLVSGPEGLGKTELLRACEYGILSRNPELSISCTHFEESKKTLLKGLACYSLDENCRDPDNPVSNDKLIKGVEPFAEKLFINDFYKMNDEMNVAGFIDKLKYLHNVCGCKYFFFDPINQLRPETKEETLIQFLDGIAMGAAKFAVENNVCIVWSAHVNDQGETRDSRMIGKACSIRIDIEREKDSQDEELKNTTFFRVTKNRPFSKLGSGILAQFDSSTFQMVDSDSTEVLKDIVDGIPF